MSSIRQITQNRQRKPSLLTYLFSGFIATVPMTIFMLVTQRFLPKGQRYDLPPEIITKDLAHRAHISYRMSKAQILGATLFSHFGYGAAMGLLYPPVERQTRLPIAMRGGLFGLLVWAGSYLGLLPLLRLRPSAPREPGPRNLMMILAHLIWGSALSGTARLLKTR